MKKILCSLLVAMMLASALPVSASRSFPDISGHWGEKAIQVMTESGAIKGYDDGTFKPDRTISRCEFLAIAVRATLSDYPKVKGKWWQSEYDAATYHSIINYTAMTEPIMEDPITRVEMAEIVVRCVEIKGEYIDPYRDQVEKQVKDFYEGGKYNNDFYVAKAYVAGLVTGRDDNTFDFRGNATRAEAATILYRMEHKEARIPANIVKKEIPPIVIYEGQERTNRLARVGDTVIKADGTEVVLKIGPSGVLGEGQGVAPDLGFYYNVKGDNPSRVVDTRMFSGGAREGWRSSVGTSICGDFYYVHPLTGEGHWGTEWSRLYSPSYYRMLVNDIEGKYDGEISEDKQLIWFDRIGDWMPMYRYRDGSFK